MNEVVHARLLRFIPHPGVATHPFSFDDRVTIHRIQETVADFYRVPLIDMASARRGMAEVHARQVAMTLARELTPNSLPDIAHRFGKRDHTTVIHAIRKIARLSSGDPQLAQDIKTLRKRLGA